MSEFIEPRHNKPQLDEGRIKDFMGKTFDLIGITITSVPEAAQAITHRTAVFVSIGAEALRIR